MLRLLFLWLCCVCAEGLFAQESRALADHIKTLVVEANGRWDKAPVVNLDARDGYVRISFDDLTHEYRRYMYKIELCNYDWTPNDQLLDVDYLTGFNDGQPIENYVKSSNTTQIYTHYSFRIPNGNVRLKAAGNYRVIVYDDDDPDTPVLEACFSLVSPQVVLSGEVSADTDVDRNATHQQLDISVNFNRLQVQDPRNEIKLVVRQNYRWDNARMAPPTNYVTANGMQWTHNRELIFDAGSEYRKFEVLDFHNPAMGVDHVRWFDPYYHITLLCDEPRKNYIYTEDRNGAFLVRNEDNTDNETVSDYMVVHYSLKMPERRDLRFYVCGRWQPSFVKENEMKYNPAEGCYELAALQKQGYYNYQYLALDAAGRARAVGETAPAEGNFYQTENCYDVFVYYCPRGGRYHRLVGYGELRYGANR